MSADARSKSVALVFCIALMSDWLGGWDKSTVSFTLFRDSGSGGCALLWLNGMAVPYSSWSSLLGGGEHSLWRCMPGVTVGAVMVAGIAVPYSWCSSSLGEGEQSCWICMPGVTVGAVIGASAVMGDAAVMGATVAVGRWCGDVGCG